MEQKPKDALGAPEGIAGVPDDLAGDVGEEQEVGPTEAIADVVPPPPARRTRAWDYWSS